MEETLNSLDKQKQIRNISRFEYKFVIPSYVGSLMRKDLIDICQLDGFAKKRGFYVNKSLYYDTMDFSDYSEYVNGEKKRKKVRIRRYSLESELANLEIKEKLNKFIYKRKKKDTIDICKSVIAKPFDYINESGFEEIAEKLALKVYLPVLNCEYQRIPLKDNFGQNVRITFDYNLRCGPPQMFDRECTQSDLRVLAPNLEILEIKYKNSLPRWCISLIKKHGLSTTTFSKYSKSVERMFMNEPVLFEC